MSTVKFCRYCAKFLFASEFTVRRASDDGLSFKCRSCSSAYNKAHYAADPSKAKARAVKWANANPMRRKEICRKSADKHIEHNRRRGLERSKRLWREDPITQRVLAVFQQHIRRARMRGVVCDLTTSQRDDLLSAADGFCIYCASKTNLTLDHFSPISKGGGHTKSNIVPCCKSCNCSKNNRSADDWIYETHGVNGLARTLAFIEGLTFWRSAKAATQSDIENWIPA